MEFAGHAAHLARDLTDRAQGLGQILGSDDDEGDTADQHHLTPTHVEHGVARPAADGLCLVTAGGLA